MADPIREERRGAQLERLAALPRPHVVAAPHLLGAIAKRKQLFDDAGHRKTALVGFEEICLRPRYSLVRTEWQWVFEQASGEISPIQRINMRAAALAGSMRRTTCNFLK
jgi:hypothetical protein